PLPSLVPGCSLMPASAPSLAPPSSAVPSAADVELVGEPSDVASDAPPAGPSLPLLTPPPVAVPSPKPPLAPGRSSAPVLTPPPALTPGLVVPEFGLSVGSKLSAGESAAPPLAVA